MALSTTLRMVIFMTSNIHDRNQKIIVIPLIVILSTIGSLLAYHDGVRGMALIATVTTFALLMAGCGLLTIDTIVMHLQQYLAKPLHLWSILGLLIVPYIVYVIGNSSLNAIGTAKLLGFLLAPTLLLYLAKEKFSAQKPFFWLLAAILCIWLPFDFRCLNQIWTGKVVYAFNTLLAINLAVILFVGYYKLMGVGYQLQLNRKVFSQAIINFIGFAPLAIGLGLLTHFITWQPRHHSLLEFCLRGLGILFFTAIPEELLFRGLIQNILTKRLNNAWLALLIASAIFGAAHLNNAPYPKNIIYCGLATLAGIFYGRGYQVTGTIWAGAITHAMIDLTWHEWFS